MGLALVLALSVGDLGCSRRGVGSGGIGSASGSASGRASGWESAGWRAAVGRAPGLYLSVGVWYRWSVLLVLGAGFGRMVLVWACSLRSACLWGWHSGGRNLLGSLSKMTSFVAACS